MVISIASSFTRIAESFLYATMPSSHSFQPHFFNSQHFSISFSQGHYWIFLSFHDCFIDWDRFSHFIESLDVISIRDTDSFQYTFLDRPLTGRQAEPPQLSEARFFDVSEARWLRYASIFSSTYYWFSSLLHDTEIDCFLRLMFISVI